MTGRYETELNFYSRHSRSKSRHQIYSLSSNTLGKLIRHPIPTLTASHKNSYSPANSSRSREGLTHGLELVKNFQESNRKVHDFLDHRQAYREVPSEDNRQTNVIDSLNLVSVREYNTKDSAGSSNRQQWNQSHEGQTIQHISSIFNSDLIGDSLAKPRSPFLDEQNSLRVQISAINPGKQEQGHQRARFPAKLKSEESPSAQRQGVQQMIETGRFGGQQQLQNKEIRMAVSVSVESSAAKNFQSQDSHRHSPERNFRKVIPGIRFVGETQQSRSNSPKSHQQQQLFSSSMEPMFNRSKPADYFLEEVIYQGTTVPIQSPKPESEQRIKSPQISSNSASEHSSPEPYFRKASPVSHSHKLRDPDLIYQLKLSPAFQRSLPQKIQAITEFSPPRPTAIPQKVPRRDPTPPKRLQPTNFQINQLSQQSYDKKTPDIPKLIIAQTGNSLTALETNIQSILQPKLKVIQDKPIAIFRADNLSSDQQPKQLKKQEKQVMGDVKYHLDSLAQIPLQKLESQKLIEETDDLEEEMERLYHQNFHQNTKQIKKVQPPKSIPFESTVTRLDKLLNNLQTNQNLPQQTRLKLQTTYKSIQNSLKGQQQIVKSKREQLQSKKQDLEGQLYLANEGIAYNQYHRKLNKLISGSPEEDIAFGKIIINSLVSKLSLLSQMLGKSTI